MAKRTCSEAVRIIRRHIKPFEKAAKMDYDEICKLEDSQKRDKLLRERDMYLELNDIISMISICESSKFELVAFSAFEDEVDQADISSIEFEGEYVKVAFLHNFPHLSKIVLIASAVF